MRTTAADSRKPEAISDPRGMAAMIFDLMRARRFAPLFWCQFLAAFNDNLVRNLLAMLLLFRSAGRPGAAVTLAVGVFILPSLFLSGLGGELADGHDKARVARWLKLLDIGVQAVAAAGFAFNSLPTLYVALFGLGAMAALFGPVKYGLLPDHLTTGELTAGNALMEGATFLAILLGLMAGGLVASIQPPGWALVPALLAIAASAWIASWFIPPTRIAAPLLAPDRNLVRSSWRVVASLAQERREWRGALAVSWFWLTGAVALSLVPIVVKEKAGGGVAVETAINALFAVGVAAGSLAAAARARGRLVLSAAPLSAFAMAVFLIDLGLAARGADAVAVGQSLGGFFVRPAGLRLAFDVIGLAAAGGVFVVPIFAAVQAWAGEDRRARVVAAVNVLNALFMVGGSLAVAAAQAFGASEAWLLIVLGFGNAGAALWCARSLSRKRVANPAITCE